MKHYLSACIVFFTINTHAQDYTTYSLKLDNVTTPEEAKQVTDVIRSMINDQKEPFKNYPNFNDDTDTFEFNSSTSLNFEIVDDKFSSIGIQVMEFKQKDKLTPISQ